MAGELRSVKKRISATQKTQQITKAMNMVSASKLRRAQQNIIAFRPFVTKAHEIILNLMATDEKMQHPLMEKRVVKKTCYLIITSDRGLAGAFNSNVIKDFLAKIKNMDRSEFCVYPLGLYAYSFTKKMKYEFAYQRSFLSIKDEIDFTLLQKIVENIICSYVLKKFDKVVVIYNHFVNTLIQKVEEAVLLPATYEQNENITKHNNYEFDGDVKEILDTALPIYIENSIYSFILDSKASEHASRMNAMKSATDNADDVIYSLGKIYNRARQQAITLELTDIVGGASIVNEG